MDDLISRQAAIDTITAYPHGDVWNVENMENMVYEIKNLPSAQSKLLQLWEVFVAQAVLPQPGIVRCGDCKYAEYINDVQTLWCTECGQDRTVAPNDFCSYAERRENG